MRRIRRAISFRARICITGAIAFLLVNLLGAMTVPICSWHGNTLYFVPVAESRLGPDLHEHFGTWTFGTEIIPGLLGGQPAEEVNHYYLFIRVRSVRMVLGKRKNAPVYKFLAHENVIS